MLIRDRMTPSPITATEDMTIGQAVDLMARRSIHQLPVVRANDRLVGIITDRDCRTVPADRRGEPVSRFMTPNPVTVQPDEPLEEALLLLHHHRFGSLPVVWPAPGGAGDDALAQLVGIITHTDILSALIDMLGIEEPGTRLEIDLPDTDAGRICGCLAAVGQGGARVISLIVSNPSGDPAQRPRLYVRLSTIDVRAAVEALTQAGFRLTTPVKALAKT